MTMNQQIKTLKKKTKIHIIQIFHKMKNKTIIYLKIILIMDKKNLKILLMKKKEQIILIILPKIYLVKPKKIAIVY